MGDIDGARSLVRICIREIVGNYDRAKLESARIIIPSRLKRLGIHAKRAFVRAGNAITCQMWQKKKNGTRIVFCVSAIYRLNIFNSFFYVRDFHYLFINRAH